MLTPHDLQCAGQRSTSPALPLTNSTGLSLSCSRPSLPIRCPCLHFSRRPVCLPRQCLWGQRVWKIMCNFSSGLRWCPRQNGIPGSQLRHHVGLAFASNQFVASTRMAPRSTVSTVTTRSIVPRSTATRPFSAPCAPVWTPKSSTVPQVVVRTPVLFQSERVQVCLGGDGHWSLCHDFHRCLRAVVETLRCGTTLLASTVQPHAVQVPTVASLLAKVKTWSMRPVLRTQSVLSQSTTSLLNIIISGAQSASWHQTHMTRKFTP